MLLRIREWRRLFGLTQAALATLCGLARETISAIELGRQDATTTQLKSIADALQLRVSDLLDERCPQCPYRGHTPPDDRDADDRDADDRAPTLTMLTLDQPAGRVGLRGVRAQVDALRQRVRRGAGSLEIPRRWGTGLLLLLAGGLA